VTSPQVTSPTSRTLHPMTNPRQGLVPAHLVHAALIIVASLTGCGGPPGPQADKAAIAALARIERPASAPAGGHVSALAAGPDNGAPIIFVHGTPGSAEGWADFLVDAPEGEWRIAIDRPGFGHSGPAQGAVTSLAAQAAALEPFLSAARPAILVGHSMGGPIVVKAAIAYPGKVAAVVVVAGSLDPALEKIHPLQPVGAWGPLKALLPRAIRNTNDELMALKPELTSLAGDLPSLTQPVIIIHGTKDNLCPFENVAYMEKHLTNAPHVSHVLEGRNHFLPWHSRDVIEAGIREARQMAAPAAHTP